MIERRLVLAQSCLITALLATVHIYQTLLSCQHQRWDRKMSLFIHQKKRTAAEEPVHKYNPNHIKKVTKIQLSCSDENIIGPSPLTGISIIEDTEVMTFSQIQLENNHEHCPSGEPSR